MKAIVTTTRKAASEKEAKKMIFIAGVFVITACVVMGLMVHFFGYTDLYGYGM